MTIRDDNMGQKNSETDLTTLIRIASLENAIKYEGKATSKSVLGALMGGHPELRPQVKSLFPQIDKIVQETNKLSREKQRTQLESLSPNRPKEDVVNTKRSSGHLPDLANTEQYPTIRMRLAPYPSGPLHIGNARMVILNDEYVKRYKGELILAYDDTIGGGGKAILPEAYDYIRENLEWLGVKIHKTIYKSDRVPIYYEHATKLISQQAAYVCLCPGDRFREHNKLQKQDCPDRSLDVSIHLERWEKMLEGHYQPGEAVVRLKTAMDHPNPALRDNVMLRIANTPHPRVGDKYTVWPLLEFNWAIDDHLLDITHILRGKDLVKEDILETWIWDVFHWPKREFIHYGRMRFKDLRLSKSFAAKMIREKTYSGWQDPRTWSLNSLQYRGIRPEAVRLAILELGTSKVDIDYSPKPIYANNRRLIDQMANRYFSILNPRTLVIQELPRSITAGIPLHPDDASRGTRKLTVSALNNTGTVWIDDADLKRLKPKMILRLKDLCNVEILALDSENVQTRYLDNSLATIREQKGRIIHWLPIDDTLPLTLMYPTGDQIQGLCESTLSKLPLSPTGTLIQFERVGFVNVHHTSPEIYAVFAHK